MEKIYQNDPIRNNKRFIVSQRYVCIRKHNRSIVGISKKLSKTLLHLINKWKVKTNLKELINLHRQHKHTHTHTHHTLN